MIRIRLPDVQTGYELSQKGWFSVVVPEASTNLIQNPSFEAGSVPYSSMDGGARTYIYGYTARNSTTAASTTYQYDAATGCKITPSSIAVAGLYNAVALTSGTVYTASAYLQGSPGDEYTLVCTTAASVLVSGTKYTRGNNYWQRLTCSFAAPATDTFRIQLLRKAGGTLAPFYTDCWQLEEKVYATTWFCGFSSEKNSFSLLKQPYTWAGIPHASISYRYLDAKNGGKIVNLNDKHFAMYGIVGLGMNDANNVIQELSTGRGYYSKTTPTLRNFSLIGEIGGRDYQELAKNKNELFELVSPFGHNPNQQPMLMLYQPLDDCGDPIGKILRIYCFYKDGLAGETDSLYLERITINFEMADPMLYGDSYNSIELGFQTKLSDVNNILERDRDGLWKKLDIGIDDNGAAYRIIKGQNGKIYFFGDFASMGGVARTAYLAIWNGTAWESLFDTANPDDCIYDACFTPDGKLYITGAFTSVNAVACYRLAMWDGTNWNACIDTATAENGFNQIGRAILCGYDGNIYIGGDFTATGTGGAGAFALDRFARWNPTTVAMVDVGGTDGHINALAMSKGGVIYVGGEFGHVEAIDSAYIGMYNPVTNTWAALNDQMDAKVNSLSFSDSGNLFIAGNFHTSVDGVLLNHVARYDGAMNPLLEGVNDNADCVLAVNNNEVYFGGAFTGFTMGGTVITIPRGKAMWNGTSFLPLDVEIDRNTARVMAFMKTYNGELYISFNAINSDDAYSATITAKTISNQKTYPYFRISGPGTLWMIKNYTTGKAIYFNALTLLDKEIFHLNLEEVGTEIYNAFSNLRGNLSNFILPGSDINNYLAPGANNISCYLYGSTSANTTSFMFYHDRFLSIEGAIK
jgi:hypothetical protein